MTQITGSVQTGLSCPDSGWTGERLCSASITGRNEHEPFSISWTVRFRVKRRNGFVAGHLHRGEPRPPGVIGKIEYEFLELIARDIFARERRLDMRLDGLVGPGAGEGDPVAIAGERPGRSQNSTNTESMTPLPVNTLIPSDASLTITSLDRLRPASFPLPQRPSRSAPKGSSITSSMAESNSPR
ncbi:MAG: hypothetical protein CL933_02130 [Deltaproteobacteria bacterium]|nr:hypothetical protein [Deltaproteobacteria bacterium]